MSPPPPPPPRNMNSGAVLQTQECDAAAAEPRTACRPCRARSPCDCPGHPGEAGPTGHLSGCLRACICEMGRAGPAQLWLGVPPRVSWVRSEVPRQHGGAGGVKVMATCADCGPAASTRSGTYSIPRKQGPADTGPGGPAGTSETDTQCSVLSNGDAVKSRTQ